MASTKTPPEQPAALDASDAGIDEPAEALGTDLAAIAVEAARDRKAEDLRVLDLSQLSGFTDRFVICTGTNDRQVKAIADRVLERLREEGRRPLHVEGHDHARWVLIDFGGELVVHVFLRDARRFYDLERLWSDAPDLTERFPE